MVFAGVIQWRFSTKQIEEIRRRAKEETIEEILSELSISSFSELNKDLEARFSTNKKEVNYVKFKLREYQFSQLEYEVTKISQREVFVGRLSYLLDVYRNFLVENPDFFTRIVEKYDSIISIRYHEKKLDINDRLIDAIIEKMYSIDSDSGNTSEQVRRLSSSVAMYRKENN